MTENSPSEVGRPAVDAYLDSVELALIAADAPRIDRVQVLQDLEAQIADMLAQQPTPLTEESVRSVLDKLEPPSHFAATYGNGKQTAPLPLPSYFLRLPRAPWPLIATISCALLCIGCLFMVFAVAVHDRGLLDFLIFLVLVTVILTPVALWMAHKQLRAHPNTPRRDLVLKSTAAYAALVTALVLLFLAAITKGFVLAALGVAAFVYFEYWLIRRNEVSTYYLSLEIRTAWDGMQIAIPPQHWRTFATQSDEDFATTLREIAGSMQLARYKKHPRGPKKKPPKKTKYNNGAHVSTAKLIAERTSR